MNETFVKSIEFSFDDEHFEIKIENIIMFDCTIQPGLTNCGLFDIGRFAIDSFSVIVLNDKLDFDVKNLEKAFKNKHLTYTKIELLNGIIFELISYEIWENYKIITNKYGDFELHFDRSILHDQDCYVIEDRTRRELKKYLKERLSYL